MEEQIELIDAILILIEAGIFTSKQFQNARRLLNQIPAESQTNQQVLACRKRVLALERPSRD